MNRRLKLGKKHARLGAVKFRMEKYVDFTKLPKIPDEFGHDDLIKYWGMLGNSDCGDCVWAGAAHETMLWRKQAGNDVVFDANAVVSDYSAATGFDPNDPSTDGGSDMQLAAEYRRKIGVVDSNGVRHRILAYLALDPSNLEQFYAAMYVFGAVGLGIRFPSSAGEQFDQMQPWSPVSGASIDGGHYVPCIAKRGGSVFCVTWGQLQEITPAFLTEYADEAIAYLTAESLLDGKTLEGFDLNVLAADLAALKPTYNPDDFSPLPSPTPTDIPAKP